MIKEVNSPKPLKELSEEKKDDIIEKFFSSTATLMYKKDFTFISLFLPHLFDLVFNNTETRIVSTASFFSTLISSCGYEVSENIL